jgi:hypothetical protein
VKEREQGTPTNWRVQKEGEVRTAKESKLARGTHSLQNTEGGTNYNLKESKKAC